jgi:hypothetical protein
VASNLTVWRFVRWSFSLALQCCLDSRLGHALAFFRNNTMPEAVVATRFPQMVYIYTQRQGFPVISDDSWMTGHFGARPEFLAWLRAIGNRTVFAYSQCPGTAKDPKLCKWRRCCAIIDFG